MTVSGPRVRRTAVALGERAYDIEIGPGLLAGLGQQIAPLLSAPRVFVLSDETVAGLHGAALSAGLESAGLKAHWFKVSPGEASKSFSSLERVLDWLIGAGASRSDILVVFGGGVVGDLGGLAAALMKRGMGLVQVPTTLLAQVDSSVGGKTAVNTRQGKNLIGAFYQPSRVVIDTDLLATLPVRERAAGYAEIVKYGLIDDASFFDWLEANGEAVMALDSEPLAEAIARSCAAKAKIVAADEREGGVRALLNLGHTFGHALEAENGYGPALLHGEAVACGMVLAFGYSARLGVCDETAGRRAAAVLERAGLVTDIARLSGGPYEAGRLVMHMKQDKKVRGDRLPLILARGIGSAFIHPDADTADLELFLREHLSGDPAGRHR